MSKIHNSPRFTAEMQEIISNDNFLTGLALPEYDIILLMGWTGGPNVTYALWYKNDVLFTGSDYKPSPFFNYDSLENVVNCLSFLTVQEHATGSEYFKDYTPAQLEFTRLFLCEELNGKISDFDDRDGEYHAEAVEYFRSCVVTYDSLTAA